MKNILLPFAAVAYIVLCTTSCSSHVKEGTAVADDFFLSYSEAEYEKAMEYCNDEVREAVQETITLVESLDSKLREAYLEICQESTPERVSVFEHTKDSLTVEYHTLISGELEPICNAVTVVYDQTDQKWQVVDVR